MADIKWRKPDAWSSFASRINKATLYQMILLVWWRNGDVTTEAVYALGDKLVQGFALATFRTDAPDPTKWKKWAVAHTQRSKTHQPEA